MDTWLATLLGAIAVAVVVYWIERRRLINEGIWISKKHGQAIDRLYAKKFQVAPVRDERQPVKDEVLYIEMRSLSARQESILSELQEIRGRLAEESSVPVTLNWLGQKMDRMSNQLDAIIKLPQERNGGSQKNISGDEKQ